MTRLEQFTKDFKTSQATVFCVKCGSTKVDQNFRTQLQCYNCDNISIWDASRFSIMRKGCEHDVVSAFEPRDESDDGSWNTSIYESITPFLRDLTQMSSVISSKGSPKIIKEDLPILCTKWAEVKARVDATIQNLIERDDSTHDFKDQ